jgi:hypothetical protein
MINFIKKIFTNRDNQNQDKDNIVEEIILDNNLPEFQIDLLGSDDDSCETSDNNILENSNSTPIIFNENILTQKFNSWRRSTNIYSEELGRYQEENLKLYSWQVKEGEWVEEGKPLCEICWNGNYRYIEGGNYKDLNYTARINAPKSGFVKYIKITDDEICNGDLVGYINNTIEDEEDIMSDNPYVYYFNINHFEFNSEFLYDLNGFIINHFITIYNIKWHKNDLQFVKEGDLIFSFEYEINEYQKPIEKGIKQHFTRKNGYLDINKNKQFGLNNINCFTYKLHSYYNQLYNQKFQNQPLIQIDEFNDSVKINWKTVGGYIYHYEIPSDTTIGGVILNTDDGRSFIFSFEFYEGKDYLVFYYSIKDFKISIGNKISFLFEDNIKHIFNVIEKPIRCKIIGSKLYETKVQITSDELKSFSSKNLLKWKIEDPVNNTSFICEAKNHHWYTKDLLQAVIKNLASEYSNLVLENDINYSPLIERNELKIVCRDNNEECYVYLMIDTTNNFHKIGISNNPKYREKTLQSDKPTIELLHKKSFPNRKIAEVLEKTLHITYSNKRIRGEWFNLDSDEISEIIILLN